MKRVKLIVAYDGTGYCGWQVQPNEITVEGVLNKHISELTGEDIKVIGASRTDSGVHALGNVAVFDTESRIPGEKMAKALNARLPEDIIIQDSKEVPLDYHPRFQDTRKTYEYTFYNARYDNPVTSRHHHFVYVPLDVEKMKEAASYFLGEHCFISMCSSKAQVTSYVREIYECDVTQNGRYITMRVTGSGFLYNMVRIITGTLVKVGLGVYPPEHMEEILEARDRSAAGPTIPAVGLTLVSLEYEKELRPFLEGQNRHWHYVLDQREAGDGGPARLTVYRCGEEEFERLVKRVVHQAYRNGAGSVIVTDAEKDRFRAGDRYGFYKVVKNGTGFQMEDAGPE